MTALLLRLRQLYLSTASSSKGHFSGQYNRTEGGDSCGSIRCLFFQCPLPVLAADGLHVAITFDILKKHSSASSHTHIYSFYSKSVQFRAVLAHATPLEVIGGPEANEKPHPFGPSTSYGREQTSRTPAVLFASIRAARVV